MDVLALSAAAATLTTVLTLLLAFYANGAVGTQVRGRLEGILSGTASVVEGPSSSPLRESRNVAGALRFFVSGAWQERMAHDLSRADSNMQPADFVAIRAALACVGFAAPYLILGNMLGLGIGAVAAVVGFMLPAIYMNRRREGRSKNLEGQLPETLTLVANSLKAGFGLLQSLSLAAEQMEHPVGTELNQTIHEMHIGSSAEEALLDLSERCGSYDLDLVVTAILVQRSVGGNLAEILETVAETMRERVRIRGEIATLTAQQSMTGIIIGLLPLVVGGFFMIVSPEYIGLLFTESLGRIMLGVGILLETVGILIIRRILAIEV
ncbi:MAG: type II secretion system F family protein [Dehalococcoidia bacterium]